MIKNSSKWCSLFLTVIIFLNFMLPLTVSAVDSTSENSASVVFVIDDTRSMKTNDPQKLTAVAVEKYIDKLDNKENIGNRVGIVTFSKQVLKSKDIVNVDTSEGKDEVKKYVKNNVTQNGTFTNCVVGIERAVAMLQKDNHKNKAIILVTDGEYDFDTNNGSASSQLNAANSSLEQRLKVAKENGIKIYTIKIEGKGDANDGKVDFNKIASATSGESYSAKNANEAEADVDAIQKDLLKLSGETIEEELPKGVTKKEFKIPVGVVYAVIQIDHKVPIEIRDFTYESGDTVDYTVSEGTGYTNVRMSNPVSGKTIMSIYSSADQKATINFVFASKMTVDAKISTNTVSAEDVFEIAATVYNEGKVYDNSNNSIGVEAVVKDDNGKEFNSFAMTQDTTTKQFKVSPKIDVPGNYTVSVIISGTGISSTAMNITVEKAGLSPIIWVIIAVVALLVIAAIILLFLKRGGGTPMPFGRFQYNYSNYRDNEFENFNVWTLDTVADKRTKSVSVLRLMNNNPNLSALSGIVFVATGNKKAPILQIKNATTDCEVRVGMVSVGPNPIEIKQGDEITIRMSDPEVEITASRL